MTGALGSHRARRVGGDSTDGAVLVGTRGSVLVSAQVSDRPPFLAPAMTRASRPPSPLGGRSYDQGRRRLRPGEGPFADLTRRSPRLRPVAIGIGVAVTPVVDFLNEECAF